MSKISVIIPVYNTAKYLAESLDSVLAQTFKDIEIICINDGSSDNSLSILNKYAKKDKRIKVINQDNLGVIAARNNAIAIAKSEYIYPLDSDDIITPDCLEKLYNAMLSGKGDIITCRVMYFGRENNEMELKKPTKYNMALGNRLVNAALFRKKDFVKSGGYDPAFNACLEDYDLWLNMVFNLNLKIYRIPEILFYYRLKPISEARNFQCRSEHAQHINICLQKYPKMRMYVKLSKIKKLPKKILHFFFRIQNYKIKIFKIPVYRIRKYDTVISVGAACFVPEVLKELNLRDFSGPFDWMFGGDILTRLKFVKTKFKNYFNCEDFKFIGENPDNGKMIYKNTKSGICYNHDFPRGKFKDVFSPVAQKYQRRTDRMISHLEKNEHVLLVFSELGNSCDIEKISKLLNEINKKYTATIDLLYIDNNKNIKLNTFKKPKRISKNLIYAQYHYEKYPDELPQARRILKKILKKVAKMKTPKVSVIMPAYNTEKYVGEAIESILNQTFTDFEFIILNDGSTDNTAKIIKEYAKKDKRIKFIDNKKNQGFIASLNQCLEFATGEYIAKMDSDDISMPERFAKQVKYLDLHKDIGLVGCGYKAFDKADFEIINPEKVGILDLLKGCYTTVFMLRKKIIDANNLRFNKEYMHAEDYDFYAQFRKLAPIHNIQEVLYLYRWHGENTSIKKAEIQQKNSQKVRQDLLDFLSDDKKIQQHILDLVFNKNKIGILLPKWLGRICCLFIFKRDARHNFRNKYVKG